MESLYIKEIILGDVSKFSYFVSKYKDMSFVIAFRIVKNKEDAEEVVQDSFLRAYKSLGKFKHNSKFSTWLYRIVVNTSLTKVKRRSTINNIDIEEVPDIFIENVESIYGGLANEEQKKFINHALNELNVEDSLLLTLYYINENSIDEIGEITDISNKNIKMKLYRARKRMYVVLNKILKLEMKEII